MAKYTTAQGGQIAIASNVDIPTALGKKGYNLKIVSATDEKIHVMFSKDDGIKMSRRKNYSGEYPWHMQKHLTKEVSESITSFVATEVTYTKTSFGLMIHTPEPEKRITPTKKRGKFTAVISRKAPADTFGPGSDIKQLRYITRVKKLVSQLNVIKQKTDIEYIIDKGVIKAKVKVEI